MACFNVSRSYYGDFGVIHVSITFFPVFTCSSGVLKLD